jgi:inhibitor of KinA sporulation pathway (predicted exonuclease)
VHSAITQLCQSGVKTLQKFWAPALSTVGKSNFRIFRHHIPKKKKDWLTWGFELDIRIHPVNLQ